MKGEAMRSHVMQRNHAGALWAVSLLAVMLVLTGGPAVARAEEAGPASSPATTAASTRPRSSASSTGSCPTRLRGNIDGE